jgi:hypothetical protein
MTRGEEKRICPHCGAENPRHAEVTRCVRCAQLLDRSVRPPIIGLPPASDSSDREGARPKAREAAERARSEPLRPPGGWRAALTVPVGVHPFLFVPGVMGGFIGGCLLMHSLSDWFEAIMPGLTVLGVFAGAMLGVIIPAPILRFVVLARCPKCSGPAVPLRHEAVPAYQCKSCGHVHRIRGPWGHYR